MKMNVLGGELNVYLCGVCDTWVQIKNNSLI